MLAREPDFALNIPSRLLGLSSGAPILCLDSIILYSIGVISSLSSSRTQRRYRTPKALRLGQSTDTWLAAKMRELFPSFA